MTCSKRIISGLYTVKQNLITFLELDNSQQRDEYKAKFILLKRKFIIFIVLLITLIFNLTLNLKVIVSIKANLINKNSIDITSNITDLGILNRTRLLDTYIIQGNHQ